MESALGHHERAATLLGSADSLWEVMGRPLATYQHMYPIHEACVGSAIEQLGSAGYEAAFEKGAAFSVDDSIAHALGERSPVPAPSSEPGTVLTARELEIAELIAEGLSNRQIAARFTISVRTVETHAQHIMVKLGFRNRAQIASWVAERHATEPATPDAGPGPSSG